MSGDPTTGRAPRLLFFALGFPPAAKSSAYRLCEMANQFAAFGWDVTVVNGDRDCWAVETGLDLSMLEHVDPRVRVVEVPVRRWDLDNDIRTFSRQRARDPLGWIQEYDRRAIKQFPERKLGAWRRQFEEVAVRLQEETPFDLCVVSCVPYSTLAAALRLHDQFGVPYAVDFRDGWSIDVVAGEVAFPLKSAAGRWESRALDGALSLWVVNEPIAEHYRSRYPHLADRIEVVRNGFDRESVPIADPAPIDGPLRFGYLGTVNFPPSVLTTVIEAWRSARATDLALKDAVLEIRGHNGASYARHANPRTELLLSARQDGVVFGGPVPKAEVARTYATWDALLLILIGGRFVTSGKVYEYMATGLPIVSLHEKEHDASFLLQHYPLWTDAHGLDSEQLARSFSAAAQLVKSATPEQRAAARAYASTYERHTLMAPAIERLVARVAR